MLLHQVRFLSPKQMLTNKKAVNVNIINLPWYTYILVHKHKEHRMVFLNTQINIWLLDRIWYHISKAAVQKCICNTTPWPRLLHPVVNMYPLNASLPSSYIYFPPRWCSVSFMFHRVFPQTAGHSAAVSVSQSQDIYIQHNRHDINHLAPKWTSIWKLHWHSH
jgi:hypothetical protein